MSGCCGPIITPVIDKLKAWDTRLRSLVSEKGKPRIHECPVCHKQTQFEFCSQKCKHNAKIKKGLT